MTSTTAKNYTIKDLMERYHIKTRQTVYDWCNAADISFSKDARNRSVVSEAQLAILDQLQEHLQNDGLLAGFTPISTTQLNTSLDTSTDSAVDTTVDTALDKAPPSSLDSNMETVYRSGDTHLLVQLLGAIASHLPTPSPLDEYRDLEEASTKGWLLTTAKVRTLIGTKPHGDRYQRGSWVFERHGKIGGSTAWKVSKIEL